MDRPGIWHDGVSYLIKTGTGGLSAAVRPTDWLTLAEQNGGKPAPVEAAIFDLFLDHGKGRDGSYAYVVRPGTTSEEMAASLESPEWNTLVNTSAIQAVEFPGRRLVQAVFREAGVAEADRLRLQVSRPLIVMVQEEADGRMTITCRILCTNRRRGRRTWF